VTAPFAEADARTGRSTPGLVSASEPYVDRKQLAAIMGVSVATIDRMVRAGMPSETWMKGLRELPRLGCLQAGSIG
jgi:predicted DNA-binding transcriptional regulator AlpA